MAQTQKPQISSGVVLGSVVTITGNIGGGFHDIDNNINVPTDINGNPITVTDINNNPLG